ncbi:MAG: PmoA family protein [Candidatus Poribacteria bacterium]|nr:PmoA family protein [Candidatus Poribacteria bacterium]
MLDEVPGKQVTVTEEGESVLTYYYGESVSCSHFHPLYAPNGQVVTEETEQRHPSGIYFTLGTVNDDYAKPIKLQRSNPAFDRETFRSSATEESVKFVSKTTWEAANPVLTEICKVTAYPLQNNVRILDLTVILHAASNPITFEGEIGLGYHAVEMEHRKAANASGKIGESEVNGQESEWATLCGINSDAAIGVAILPHPKNGQTVFLAEDAYQGFLFPQTAPFSLNANEKRELNYRVLIYLGDLFTIDVLDYYEDYIDSKNC